MTDLDFWLLSMILMNVLIIFTMIYNNFKWDVW